MSGPSFVRHWKLCMNCIPICGNKPFRVPNQNRNCFANDAGRHCRAQVFREKRLSQTLFWLIPASIRRAQRDFPDVIGQFIEEGVEILAGTNITPDFAGLWLQVQPA